MKIRAAVVREPGGPFELETVELDSIKQDEILVRIVACGMCHSDLLVRDQEYPLPLPLVLGHEGAGIVEKIGADITDIALGDAVVLSFDSCGICHMCSCGQASYCDELSSLNYSGVRKDGTSTIREVRGAFFYQSSFASHAIVHRRNAVRVGSTDKLSLLAMLGCGVQTGVGAVLNVLKPAPRSSIAIFGAGAVGLSAIMAARIAGCEQIIAVDRVSKRLEVARDLGATITIDATSSLPSTNILALGGVDYAIEASGVAPLVLDALRSTRTLGTVLTLGVYGGHSTADLNLSGLRSGRTIKSVTLGGSDPQTFIPQLVHLFEQGQLPLERLASFFPFERINDAAAASIDGSAIKPILLME